MYIYTNLVGDTIEFDAYRKRGKTKKTRFFYRVVAFNRLQREYHKTAVKQPQNRRQPSRRAKELLDKTVDKSFDEVLNNDVVVLESDDDRNHMQLVKVEHSIDVMKSSEIIEIDDDSDVIEQKIEKKCVKVEEKIDVNPSDIISINDDSDGMETFRDEKKCIKVEISDGDRKSDNITIDDSSDRSESNLDEMSKVSTRKSRLDEHIVNEKSSKSDISTPSEKRSSDDGQADEASLHQEINSAQLFPDLSCTPKKSFENPNNEDPDDGPQQNNDLDMEDEEEHSEFEDDCINFSQDSFMGTAFENLLKKSTNEKLVELPPLVSNLLWRSLTSSQPQNGFGYLMNACNTSHTIPNLSLTKKLTQFILEGPVSDDGVNFYDFKRTEMVAMYVDHINTKIMQSDPDVNSKINFHISPLNWHELEEALKLPLTMTTIKNIHNIGLALHMASTSLKSIVLNLSAILKGAIESQDKSLYKNQRLVQVLVREGLRKCLKQIVRIATTVMITHGYWILGDSYNERYKECKSSDESFCVSEFKSCLSSYGSIICYLTWLFCMEESIEYAHDNCCFIIRDEMLAELENIDFGLYTKGCKRVTAPIKKRIKNSMKLELILSLDSDFSEPLQVKMGKMLEVSKQLSIIL